MTSGLVFFLSTQRSKDAVLEQIQSTVMTIAVEAAAEVETSSHERIRSTDDAGGADYQTIQAKLRGVRDRSRRDDIYVAYIYTYRVSPQNPDMFSYVVDAEEPGEDHSPVGQEMTWEGQDTSGESPLRFDNAYAEETFMTDDYGTWLSAHAPLRNDSGEIVAMVGVDISATLVISKWDQITRGSLVALGIAIAIAAVLSILFSSIVTRPLSEITNMVQRIGSGHFGTRLSTDRHDEFGVVAGSINAMAESLQERDALKGALSRYVSRDAARRLIEEKMLPTLRGEKRDVTVLIADIANLNLVADRLPPEQLVELLNEYFEAMVEIIFHHSGTIDRLLGNRLIAVFGAPINDEHKERHSINAAIEMRQELARLNLKWQLGGEESFRLGVGIHTGQSLLGNIGTCGNVEFTVLGDSVDTATLIGSKSEEFSTDTLVSETTVEKVRDEFSFDEVGDVQPRGLSDFIRLYSVRQLAPA